MRAVPSRMLKQLRLGETLPPTLVSTNLPSNRGSEQQVAMFIFGPMRWTPIVGFLGSFGQGRRRDADPQIRH